MAIERNWTGFEGGVSDACIAEPTRGAVIGDGTARTGEFYCKHLSGSTPTTNVGQEVRQLNTTIGTALASGEQAKAVYRVFFRLIEQVSVNDCRLISKGNAGQLGHLVLKTDGKVAAIANATTGTTSTFALSLNKWYRADMTYTNTQGVGVNCTVDVSVSIYNEDGSLVGTVTASAAVAANTTMPAGFFFGNTTALVTSTFNYDFDDIFWIAADKTDVSLAIFPTATRITRVTATAQGASAQWTGDFRTTIDIPRETIATDEQSTPTNGNTTTFAHSSAATLKLGTIRGIIVRGYMKAASGGNDALMLNGVEYTVSTPTVYQLPALYGADYNPYSASSFDVVEYGARNKRGVSLQLGNCWLEVLHDGTDPTRNPFNDGAASWKHKTGKYTGNGTYQTISGLGFGAQFIAIKPVNSGANTYGVMKLARMGGTFCRRWSGVADNIAIQEITSDGFKVGPSTGANAAGIDYEYIAIQDGGKHALGYFMATGAYVGNGTDNRNIVIPENFQPEIVIINGNAGAVLRTSDMVGDFSVLLDTVAATADRIQALNSNGFQLGASTSINQQAGGINVVYNYIAIRIPSPLQLLIAKGKVTPAGTTFTVNNIPFAPEFILATSSATVGNFRPYWRANATHSGVNSNPWALNPSGNGNNVTTAITTISSVGFTGDALVSTTTADTFWVALFGSGQVSAAADYTGLYKVVANKRNDTLYDRSVTPSTTVDSDIPNPFAETSFLGDD